jgi:S-adenosyl-L-methionine hydrolase (adenosine-forming)
VAPPIIALLTDYGGNGPFVGALKAVILAINPAAVLLDLAHDVPPQAVEQGAFVLAQVAPLLPAGAICVAVVDPGVGTNRRAIALRTASGIFIGPDNALLSAALGEDSRGLGVQGALKAVRLPSGTKGVELKNPRYQRLPVSDTFHGRDLFAPAAAHVSLGVPLDELGPSIDDLNVYPAWRAKRVDDGSLYGRVLHVDHFGNLISDVRGADLPNKICVDIGGRRLTGPQKTFQDGPELVAYVGSAGFLEIGRRNGSAAEELQLGPGASLQVSGIR